MSNEKLLERIQKLLALSANNSSAEEAALAMEKAMAMMAEHNLTTGEFFGKFTYYELNPYKIHTMDGHGVLQGGHGFRIMEWSWDRAGVDRHTFRDWMIAKFSKEKA